jgi:hypothetical protein
MWLTKSLQSGKSGASGAGRRHANDAGCERPAGKSTLRLGVGAVRRKGPPIPEDGFEPLRAHRSRKVDALIAVRIAIARDVECDQHIVVDGAHEPVL